jgi:hypothetical protein
VRSSHGRAAGSPITTIALIGSRVGVCPRSGNVRFDAVTPISCHWTAAAKRSDRIGVGDQCPDCIGRCIKRRRIGHRGTRGARVARSYHHLDTSSFLSFNCGLQFVAGRAPFGNRTTPGINGNVGCLGRITLVWRAVERIRRQEELHALDVTSWCPVALVHVTATDPLCSRRHAYLVTHAVVTDGCAGCVRAVEEIIARLLRIIPAGVAHAVVNRVVPVEVVISSCPIPTAVTGLERVMCPANASIGAGDNDVLPGVAKGPNLRRVRVLNSRFYRGRHFRPVRHLHGTWLWQVVMNMCIAFNTRYLHSSR